MKKNIALLIAIIVLGGGASYFQERFVQSNSSTAAATSASAHSSTVAEALPSEREIEVKPPATSSLHRGLTLAEKTATVTPAQFSISIAVDGKNYAVGITNEKTVEDAMETLGTTQNFSYTTREFSGLGSFVESINGKKNSNGYYWILYVNGTSSQTGISQTPLNAGDAFEWRFEKGY